MGFLLLSLIWVIFQWFSGRRYQFYICHRKEKMLQIGMIIIFAQSIESPPCSREDHKSMWYPWLLHFTSRYQSYRMMCKIKSRQKMLWLYIWVSSYALFNPGYSSCEVWHYYCHTCDSTLCRSEIFGPLRNLPSFHYWLQPTWLT